MTKTFLEILRENSDKCRDEELNNLWEEHVVPNLDELKKVLIKASKDGYTYFVVNTEHTLGYTKDPTLGAALLPALQEPALVTKLSEYLGGVSIELKRISQVLISFTWHRGSEK